MGSTALKRLTVENTMKTMCMNGYTATAFAGKWYVFQDGKALEFETFSKFVMWASFRQAAPKIVLILSNN